MTDPSPTRRRNPVVSRHYAGQSPDERRAQRRTRLVAAGLELFGTRGVSACTIKDLCAEAGLTERYFYESFKSTGELFGVVYDDVSASLRNRTLDAVGRAPYEPMALIEAGLRVFLHFIRDDPRHARILLVEAVNSRYMPALRAANQTLLGYAGLLRQFCEALYPNYSAVRLDLDMSAAGLTGMILQTGTLWYHDDFKQPLDDILRNLMFAFRSMHLALTAELAAAAASTEPAARPDVSRPTPASEA